MLEIVCSANNAEKYIHNKISNFLRHDKFARIFVLSSEQHTLQKEKNILCDINEQGMFTLEVISFNRLAERILSGKDIKKSSSSMQALKIYSIIKEHNLFADIPDKSSLISLLQNTLSDIKRYDIRIDDILSSNDVIPAPLKNKLSQLKELNDLLSDKYTQEYDSVDFLDLAIENIGACTMFKDAILIVDGFDMLTSQIKRFLCTLISACSETVVNLDISNENDSYIYVSSQDLLNSLTEYAKEKNIETKITDLADTADSKEIAHLKANLFAYPSKTFNDKTKDILYSEHLTQADEINFCANSILDILNSQSSNLSDIAVIAPRNYHLHLSAELRSLNIPVYTNAKRTIFNSHLFAFLDSMLALISGKFYLSEITRFLFNPFTDITDTEANILFSYLRQYGQNAFVLKNKLKFIPDKFASAEDIRKKAFDFILEFNEIKSPAEFISSIKYVFERNNALNKISGLNDDFYSQAYEKTMEILDSIPHYFSFISVDDMREIIANIFSNTEISTIPPMTQEVNISEMGKMKFAKLKHLFVLGLNDNSYLDESPGFFNDSELNTMVGLGFGFARPNKIYDEKTAIKNSLALPREKLHLSCIANEDMQEWIVLSRIKKLFPDLTVLDPPVILESEFKRSPELNIDPEAAQALYGEKLSVSRLEDFAKCPFRHFLHYGLKISAEKEFNDRIDLGSIIHAALDRLTKLHLNGITFDELVNLCEDVTLDIIGSYDDAKLLNNEHSEFFKKNIALQVRECIKIIGEQLKDTNAKIFGSEITFENDLNIILKNGKTLKINGLIDRLDIYKTADKDYVRVIDYKLSGKKLDINDFFYGINIQPILYLYVISKHFELNDPVPFGAYYFDLKLPYTKTGDFSDVLTEKRMDGITLNDPDVAAAFCGTLNNSLKSVRVAIDNSGNLNKLGKVYSSEQIDMLFMHLINLIQGHANRIFSGDVSIDPYIPAKGAAVCMYCDYSDICAFESGEKIRPKKTFEDIDELYSISNSGN